MSVTHLSRGSAGYRRATLALFCAGFATFAMLYCVQPLLPLLAAHFRVSAASSSLETVPNAGRARRACPFPPSRCCLPHLLPRLDRAFNPL